MAKIHVKVVDAGIEFDVLVPSAQANNRLREIEHETGGVAEYVREA